MSRAELIAAIEAKIGLSLVPGRNAQEVVAVSPTGARLFTVSIYPSGGSWTFGGCGCLLADHWTALCELSRSGL